MMWGALFPGQGSQHAGMGRFLYEEFADARQCFEEASDALHLDFRKLCFDGSETELALTENTQPCLLLVSTATFRVLDQVLGFQPKLAAGHSVGEYAAVVAARALGFSDAMKAVRLRGQAMQEAVPVGQGGMTAVMGLSAPQVFELCKWAEDQSGDGPVQPANLNAPGQIVISGKKSALDWLQANYKAENFPSHTRVKFIPLKVSAPFHCRMMEPAEKVMTGVLNQMEFHEAHFPVVQNVEAMPIHDGKTLRQNLIRQISAPVRWIECVEKLRDSGVQKTIEVGCGRVLAGLVKKIDSSALQTFNINSLDDFKILERELGNGQ